MCCRLFRIILCVFVAEGDKRGKTSHSKVSFAVNNKIHPPLQMRMNEATTIKGVLFGKEEMHILNT